MKVFKCDLCGNYYDPYEGKIDDYDVNAIVTATFNELYGTQTQRRYDLCQDCLTAFSHFLYDRRHPTKDVVSVVRCKDCEGYIMNANNIDTCCEYSGGPDFYCARGERMVNKNDSNQA